MRSKELLEETMKELNMEEQKDIIGGGYSFYDISMIWYNLYGAFAKYGSAYPVGLLETTSYTPASGVCTSR